LFPDWKEIEEFMIRHYKKYIITSAPFNPDLISGLLWTLGITGINEEENRIEAFTDSKMSVTKDEIKSLLQKLISEKLIVSFSIEEELGEIRNWNEEWEKKLRVIEVSDKIVVKPSTKAYNTKKDQVIIEINPKMSFGTGEHQTTKLMLLALEKYIKKGMKILDVGTGTGIIAVASIKLGAASAVGIDIDEWSYLNAKENCILNKVESEIEIMLTEVNGLKEKNFDLVAANIQKNTLLEIAEDLKHRIRENGILILSGLLEEDQQEILSAYSNLQFRLLEIMKMDEWTALVFKS
jgi:ribosomal protein L11 methyltransferase